MKTIDQATVREFLDYCPISGIFTWRKKISKKTVVGAVAGSPHSAGYREIALNNKSYLAHRLAFVYVTGTCPRFVDHRDGNRSNNSWANLRSATNQQNSMNRGVQSNNRSTGVKGVYRADKKFEAEITHQGVRHRLGRFPTVEEAKKAYEDKAAELFGEWYKPS